MNSNNVVTRERLLELLRAEFPDRLLVIVSNREPYIHTFVGDRIGCTMPAGGLTAALDPVMRTSGGTWIAHGSGDADWAVASTDGRVLVPPDNPSYVLRRIHLSPAQEEGYYDGFANQGLWPLCHAAYERPVFDESQWRTYKEVNQLFAEAVEKEVGDQKALVFIQDYHFALLPAMVRERCPSALIAQFWHIPWPNQETFQICPWQEEILDGLLDNDLIGFHIRHFCENFLQTVDSGIEARIDWERSEVTRGGRRTLVRPFPIGVDFEWFCANAQRGEVEDEIRKLQARYQLEGMRIGVGLDRVDYTKGIPDRLRALDRLLEVHPEYHERLVFIQTCAASRTKIEAYRRLDEEIKGQVEEINRRYSTPSWTPVLYLPGDTLSETSLLALRRMADFFVVSSLHDGMNLVAKEFVASRFDEDGVLVLSPFTGAARELPEALLVNPYAVDLLAEGIRTALEMPLDERRQRMRQMRRTVQENNIYKWATDIFGELLKLSVLR